MLKPAAKAVLNRFPPTADYLRRRRMRKCFPVEMALIEGKSRPLSSRPSVLFYTQHKVASVYTREICRALSADSDLLFADYDQAIFAGEITQAEQDRIYNMPSPELYPTRGYCFAPIRSWHVGVPDVEPFHVILMLRDPRDVLVSLYFSMLASHALPPLPNTARENLLRERSRAAEFDIDSYVLHWCENIRRTCEHYIAALLDRPNVLFVTYEQMIRDFPQWLNRVVEHGGFSPNQATMQRLISESNFEVSQEDPTRHVRQITPGDHRRKLKPETISALNQELAPVLARLGYVI